MENQIIEKFLQCDEITSQNILKQIVAFQYDKMNQDILKVVESLRRDGDTSKRIIRIAMECVVNIYNAEMEYINVNWDKDECWWDERANTRFDSDYKSLYANCLKEKCEQSTDDWWRRIHFLHFKDIIMAN
jgi:hypothetical protein